MGCAVPGATVVEADPSGGRIALSHGFGLTPGLPEFSLLAGAAQPLETSALKPTRVLTCGATVVPAPLEGQAVESIARRLALFGADLVAVAGGPVLLDLGRAMPGEGAQRELLAECDVVMLVARCDVVSLGLANRLVPDLLAFDQPAGLVLVHDGMCAPDSATRRLGLPLWGVVPHKPRHAERLWHPAATQSARNNAIVKAASGVMATSLGFAVRTTESVAA
jgi:hypothetical protein